MRHDDTEINIMQMHMNAMDLHVYTRTFVHTYIHTYMHTYLPLSISIIHLLFHGRIMAIDETFTPTLCSPRRVLPSTHVLECTLAHLAPHH